MRAIAPSFLLLMLAGCAGPAPDEGATPAPSSSTGAEADRQATASQPEPVDVCAVLPADKVSTIMGVPMKSAPPDGAAIGCNYMPVDGFVPYAFIEVSPGAGEAAMAGAGSAASLTDGAVDPLAGIGDDARRVGGEDVWIRKGADQVSMTVTRSDEQLTQVRALYEALAPHL